MTWYRSRSRPYWSGEMIRRWQNTKICRAGWWSRCETRLQRNFSGSGVMWSSPLTEISAITETSCEPSFRDSLPRQLTADEKDLLCMYYELRLSHREIGRLLGISEAASRMRLIRARDSYEKWKKLEEKTEKKLLHRVQLHKYRDEEVLECPKRKEYPGAAGRAL